MKYSLVNGKNLRSSKLIFGIPILLICLTFWYLSGEEEEKKSIDPQVKAIFSSHIFEGCPPQSYRWDDPEILKLLSDTPEEAECRREPGITLLKNGEVHFNKDFHDHLAHSCKARCAYRDGGYEYTFGPWCTVGDDCRKFTCDFVYINCWKDEKLVHLDVHMQIYEHKRDLANEFGRAYKPHQLPPQSLVNSSSYHPNVYIIVLDSAGRYPAMRQLKKTYKFMMDELKAIDFKQFTRVAYSSRENAFSGFFGIIAEKVDRTAFGGTILERNTECHAYYDDRNYIQFEYEDAGYRTLFAYDYLLDLYMYVDCMGMLNDPSTHFSRPFQLLTILPEEVWIKRPFLEYGYKYLDDQLLRKHIRNSTRCGQNYNHMLKYTEEFMNAYEGIPKFGILWTNEAHGDERAFRVSDKYYEKFLRENKKQLEESFVIIMGDHGQREGNIIGTPQGKFEVSNNLMLFSVPKRLRGSPLEAMAKRNAEELLSLHDLHATLIDIIRHQPAMNFQGQAYQKINATLGNSWLRKLDPELKRSCRYLPIPTQYCPCNYGEHEPVPRQDSMWMILPKLIQSDFNEYLAENKLTDLCEKIAIENVTLITKVQTGETSMNYHAEFYTTRNASFSVDYKLFDNGHLEMAPREFVRVNRYGTTGNCLLTGLGLFKPVCYCKIQQ